MSLFLDTDPISSRGRASPWGRLIRWVINCLSLIELDTKMLSTNNFATVTVTRISRDLLWYEKTGNYIRVDCCGYIVKVRFVLTKGQLLVLVLWGFFSFAVAACPSILMLLLNCCCFKRNKWTNEYWNCVIGKVIQFRSQVIAMRRKE